MAADGPQPDILAKKSQSDQFRVSLIPGQSRAKPESAEMSAGAQGLLCYVVASSVLCSCSKATVHDHSETSDSDSVMWNIRILQSERHWLSDFLIVGSVTNNKNNAVFLISYIYIYLYIEDRRYFHSLLLGCNVFCYLQAVIGFSSLQFTVRIRVQSPETIVIIVSAFIVVKLIDVFIIIDFAATSWKL